MGLGMVGPDDGARFIGGIFLFLLFVAFVSLLAVHFIVPGLNAASNVLSSSTQWGRSARKGIFFVFLSLFGMTIAASAILYSRSTSDIGPMDCTANDFDCLHAKDLRDAARSPFLDLLHRKQ